MADLTVWPSNPRAVMKILMRTVKKTKTVAKLFIVFSLECFLASFRSYFTAAIESHTRRHSQVLERITTQ